MKNSLMFYREVNGKTKKEVAEYLGMTSTNYASIEKGATRITDDKLLKLSRYYGVAVDALLREHSETLQMAGRDDLYKQAKTYLTMSYRLDAEDLIFMEKYLSMSPKNRRTLRKLIMNPL